MKKVFLFLAVLFSITISITLISAGFGVDDPNLPKLSRSIDVIGGVPDGGGGIIDPGDISHNDLSDLLWKYNSVRFQEMLRQIYANYNRTPKGKPPPEGMYT